MSTDTKPTNPKDIIGQTKLDLGLVPDTIEGECALAYLEGALKYGRFNWRIAGVRASIYNAALRRHLKRWWNGENEDKTTRVKHLASVIACAGILLDAELCGKLEDDRPPAVDLDKLLNVEDRIAHLKALFKDHHPKQYTIADTRKEGPRTWPEPVNYDTRTLPGGITFHPHPHDKPRVLGNGAVLVPSEAAQAVERHKNDLDQWPPLTAAQAALAVEKARACPTAQMIGASEAEGANMTAPANGKEAEARVDKILDELAELGQTMEARVDKIIGDGNGGAPKRS